MSQEVQGMLIQLEATTAQLRREMASADDVVARTTRQIDRNLSNVDEAFDRAGQRAQQGASLIRGAFAAIAGAGLVGGMIKQIDSVGQMSDRMRELTGSAGEYNQVQARLLQTAKQTYRPLQEAQELYLLTADSIKGMGYNTQQALDITDSFSYLLVTNASSADKARSALDAYSKSLMTGKVGADEWRSILSAMPTVVKALADATGMSVEEIKRLGIEGKLSLDDLNKGFLNTVEANQAAAERMRASVTDALVNINTAIGVYLGRAEEGVGAADALASALGVVADNIEVVAAVVGGVAAGAMAAYTAKAAAATVETVRGIKAAIADRAARIAQADATLQAAIAEQRKAQTSVLLAAREAQAARGTAVQTQMSIQLAQARQREAAATVAVTAAQAGLKTASTGLLALLGGPMGLALLAGTAAASFLLLRDNAEEATSKLPDLAAGVDQVRKAFLELGKAEQKIELTRLSQQIDEEKAAAIASLAELREAYANALYGASGNRLPTAEAEAALGRLNQAMAQAQQGVAVNWLEIAESMQGVRGISETLVDKTLAVAASQEASGRAVGELTGRQLLLTSALQENTAAQVENNAAQAGMSKSAADYIAAIEKRTAAVRDGNDPIAQANRHIQEHGKYTADETAAILKAAAAQKAAQDERTKATTGRKASTKSITDQISAIDALIAKYDPATKAQKDYDAGMALADAQYKANKLSAEQYQKVVQGLYADLNKPIWAQHNKQADEAAKRIKAVDDAVQGVLDRLDPATAAARKYAAEQKSITDAMREHPEHADEFRGALEKLRAEYDDNQRAASQWGQFTERALDSVDQSFAAAWKNIDQGFSGFADSLKDAFKNLLAELAHLAITRPILMQIGTALGVGGLAGQSSGLLGSLGGGDSAGGGMDVFSLVKNGYNIANSGFGQAVAQGWGSGGLSGAVSGGWNYGSSAIGGLFGSGAASGGGSAIADYTGAQFGNWVGAQNAAATTWGGAATGLGSIMGGLSGAYMGYQNAGVKGAVAGGLGGWGGGTLGTMAGAAAASALSGTAMGAALGSVLPGIGTVIGAALGAAFGSKLFGGDWETKDAGLAFGVEGGDLSAQSFEYQKKKGGLFSSNKKRTKYNALDAESEAQFQGIFDATEDGVSDLLARVGISVEEGALDGLSIARRQISTQGKTDEEVQQLIGEWFSHVSDRMVAEIDGGTKGIGYSFEELAARIQSFELFNATLDTINVTLLELIPNSMAIANNLVAVAGGMEQYQTSLAGYYDNFFSDAEKTEGAIKAITEAFESADITLASSREGYRAMLEAVDLTSVAGQSMFSSLLSMAAQADAYYDILDQRAAQAAQDASNSYSLAFSAVQRAAAAEKSAAAKVYEARVSSFNDMAATATGRISELTSISGALNTALKALRGTSADAVQMLRANALAVLDSALATSRSDGSIAGIANLPDALDTIGRNNTDLYGSMEDFARDQGVTANIISELEATSGKQLTAEKQLLKTVEEMVRTAQWQYDAEMARIDSQLAYAQAQVDAVNGVNTSVLSMAAAIANLNSTMLRALATGAAGGSGAASANTPGNNASIVDGLYQSILGRDPDSAGAAYWAGQLQSGAIDYAAVAAAIERDAKINGELPAFAMGGMHRGGLRLVGENGPELEVTGPARIYSNSQTAAMLGGSGGDTAAEVRGLRADLAGMTDALKSVAKHTMQTARRVEYLERWDVDGAPPERAIA